LTALGKEETITASLEITAPADRTVTLKNVIGILEGSEPQLKDTCVLITAHYDHIGTTETGASLATSPGTETDKIYNGADDDGSGTVSVIEIARALSGLHPKRSIVFMTFFGEERGGLGSKYYADHAAFPLPQTIADLNLEQVGRTDASTGPQIKTLSVTGYDYSEVTGYLERAGTETDVKVYKDQAASDAYFERSDNVFLAQKGVPAHSITTAFEFPDYHAVGDEWQKIDYDNMAAVDKTIALALWNIAESTSPPQWNTENEKAAKFREARQKQ
jgi:Zn-dependent M28 family amino/carboxypeptidase